MTKVIDEMLIVDSRTGLGKVYKEFAKKFQIGRYTVDQQAVFNY